MKRATYAHDRWKAGLVGAALTGLTGALLALSPLLGDRLANLSYDLLLRWRPTLRPEGATLVYMDEDNAKALKQPWKTAAWDRTNYARLIERLVAFHARAVVFDILFDLPGTNDHVLARAAEAANRAGTPVLYGATFRRARPVEEQERATTQLALPVPELRTETNWGMVPAGVARGEILRLHGPDTPNLPSLATRVAEQALRRPATAAAQTRWLNYYGPPLTIPRFEFSYVVDPEFPHAARLSNQVVFVGEASPPAPLPGGGTDNWPTPFGSKCGESSGLEINATAYLNVARQDWLKTLPRWAEALILLGWGGVLGFGLTRCRPLPAFWISGAVALLCGGTALWAMWQAHFWFPFLIAVLVQAPLALVWAGLNFSRNLSREKEALERKVALLEPALEVAGWGKATSRSPSAEERANAAVQAAKGAAAESAVTVRNSDPPPSLDGRRGPAIPDHTLLRCVGKGAYGEVWLARNAVGLLHAVKVVHRAGFSSQEPFEREFRGIQRFMPVSRQHPGLVQILHVGRDDTTGCIYYVMEAGDDETTGTEILPEKYSPKTVAKEIRRLGRLPGAACIELGRALSAALDFLHAKQLIHRDIKPSNIIYVNGQPKFADIGLVTDIATTRTDVSYLGTMGYIAPEGPGRPAADLFSLGRVLYEAWTGLPCERYPELPGEVRQWPDRDLLLALNKIIMKACHPDPTQRHSSAAQFEEDLRRLQSAP